MFPIRPLLTLTPCLLLLAPALRAEVVVNVSPKGPVSTLQAARDAVRQKRAEGEKGAIRVLFEAGTYSVAQTVELKAEDSGPATGPTSYEAASGAEVILSGGQRVTDWQPAENGLWKATVPGVKEGKVYFEQLWVNGRRAIRARTPNAIESSPGGSINGGYLNAFTQGTKEMFPDVKNPSFECFVTRPKDFEILKAIPEAERADVLLTVMQTWAVSQCRIQALNESARAVRIVGRSRYPFVEFEPDQRWYAENFRAALDAPGEWFLSRDGTLYYHPREDEAMDKAAVWFPTTEKLLMLDGVQHVHFKDLKFRYAQTLYGPQGHHDGQAAANIGGVIELDRCQHVHLSGGELAHVGSYGVWFRDGNAHCSLKDMHLHDLGAGGVRLGNIVVKKPEDLTHHITVDNCIIQHGGRMFPSACGVFLAHASDCSVTYCDIGDMYYTGISAGWVWGYKPSPSKRNRFDFNHIHHLGWGVLSDMGGFYGLGRSEGTTINNNYVHDVGSYRYGGWGLYTDEGSTGVTMENNLVHDTSESTFHQHYGKWNQVSNNIFAYGRKAQIQRSRPEKHASFAYERNIVVYDIPKLLDGTWYNWEPGTLEMRDNTYWNIAGLPVQFHDTDLKGWQERTGRDEGSIVADPLFVDAAKRDFRLKPESPSLKLGFKPFDHNQAGVRGKEWREVAAKSQYPNFNEISKPWPMPDYAVDADFENMGLSFPTLPRQTVHWQNKGDSIYVSDDQAASGKRSLKFTDAPNLDPSWDPHLVLKPKYASGTVTIGFDLRLGEGAYGTIEGRGDGHPYLAGPSFTFSKGTLTEKRGKASVQVGTDSWTHIEMVTTLGEKATGKWTLRVTPDGKPMQEFKDLSCDKGWTEMNWFGFISAATDKTAFWIDNLKVKRVE